MNRIHILNEFIQSKKEIIKTSTLDLLSSSSLGFTMKAFKGESPFLRLIWTIFILSSICYCFVNLGDSIISFFKFSTITSINQVLESQPEFPAVG